jgi:hypothetical protein
LVGYYDIMMMKGRVGIGDGCSAERGKQRKRNID